MRDGCYPTLELTEKALKSVSIPTMVMPSNNDGYPSGLAEAVRRLAPNCRWAEARPNSEEPEKYTKRVLGFLAQVEG